jgi:hypothetical protein
METFDWYHQIKFLESISNLKSVIKASVDRTPNTEIANGIVVCLQQGRMFFESAKNAPPEIRPLLTFYGMIGFAKSLILARNLRKIESLKPSHGLTDISSENSRLHEIELKILTSGTFQEFNDVVSQTGQVLLLNDFNEEYYFGSSCDKSNRLNDLQISLKDILSRLPSLIDPYKDTFQENIKVLNFELESTETIGVRNFKVFLYPNRLMTDIDSLKQFVSELRVYYPFLENWCFDYASQDPMGSVFAFSNIDKKGIDEFSGQFETQLDFFTYHNMHLSGIKPIQEPSGKVIKLDSIKFNPNKINILEIREIIPPLLNVGTSSEPSFLVVQPIKKYYLSQYSLQYLGMFLLSSLVRYRPQIWVNAISKTPIGNSLFDDKALSLIEKFLDLILYDFPKMIVEEIKKKPSK